MKKYNFKIGDMVIVTELDESGKYLYSSIPYEWKYPIKVFKGKVGKVVGTTNLYLGKVEGSTIVYMVSFGNESHYFVKEYLSLAHKNSSIADNVYSVQDNNIMDVHRLLHQFPDIGDVYYYITEGFVSCKIYFGDFIDTICKKNGLYYSTLDAAKLSSTPWPVSCNKL